MKRVTFRVPEDHEIAVSAVVTDMTVTAVHGDYEASAYLQTQGDQIGHWPYGYFDSLDEALGAAGAHARASLKAQVLTSKIAKHA